MKLGAALHCHSADKEVSHKEKQHHREAAHLPNSGILPFFLRWCADQGHIPAQLLPAPLGTESCFHPISCHQPFVPPGEPHLGKPLQILEKMEHERGSCPGHPLFQSLGTGQIRPQDITAPSCHTFWITGGIPRQGCWDPTCGVRLPSTSPCWTPQLCVAGH